MSELKTLKDIPIILTDMKDGPDDEPILEHSIEIKELKQAAVEWIKDMKASEPYEGSTWAAIQWVKVFFNLKEEDLK